VELFVSRLMANPNRDLSSEEFAAPFRFAILATLTLIFSIIFMHPMNHTASGKNSGPWKIETYYFSPLILLGILKAALLKVCYCDRSCLQ